MRLATSQSVAMLPTGCLCPNMRLAVSQSVAMNTSHWVAMPQYVAALSQSVAMMATTGWLCPNARLAVLWGGLAMTVVLSPR